MNYETGSIEAERVHALPDLGSDVGEAAERRRRSRRNLLIGAILVALAVAAAWWAFAGGEEPAPQGKRAPQVPNVTVVAPGRQEVARTISVTGTLAARRDMPVGEPGAGGLVTRVLVEPGQWVRAGQVLATVDRQVQEQGIAQLAAQVTVARADANLAQQELDRAQALVGRGFISKADVDRRTATRDAALARIKVAQAALGEARERTGQLDVRAPAAGLVLTRQVEPGQIVGPGSGALFRIAMNGAFEMQARLAESDLVGLPVGARATVTPIGSSRTFAGQVWQVSPIIDAQTRQGIARIALPYNPSIRPGGFAAAEIVAGSTMAPLLPDSAVQSDERGSFVFIIGADNKVTRRDVRLGQVSDKGIAIAAGLDGTERVVLSAGGFLAPGQQVNPVMARAG
ncbi:MAG TPA: efflux RND transporter periplasmic adaptor subunit [Sphingomonas sp.]|jgi:RND family efflux transporter MFP subunit